MKLRKFNYTLILILLILIAFLFYQTSFTGNMAMITGELLSSEDYVNTYVRVDENSIYLISGCDAIMMSVSDEQAWSISLGLENVSGPRPVTHDLIRDVFDLFAIKTIMAKVEKLENDTYYARLFLQQGNKILNLDSRPSDAIAIAVRYNKPVLVKKDLMESAGRNIC